jgi:hypothetical protein
LRSDDDTRWTSSTLGSGSALQNSQCTIDVRSATISGSGNTLTVAYPVKFSQSFIGNRSVYTFTSDTAGLSSGWQYNGSWNVSN